MVICSDSVTLFTHCMPCLDPSVYFYVFNIHMSFVDGQFLFVIPSILTLLFLLYLITILYDFFRCGFEISAYGAYGGFCHLHMTLIFLMFCFIFLFNFYCKNVQIKETPTKTIIMII